MLQIFDSFFLTIENLSILSPCLFQFILQSILFILQLLWLTHIKRKIHEIKFHAIQWCSICFLRMKSCLIENLLLIDHLTDVLLPIRLVVLKPFVERTFCTIKERIDGLDLFYNGIFLLLLLGQLTVVIRIDLSLLFIIFCLNTIYIWRKFVNPTFKCFLLELQFIQLLRQCFPLFFEGLKII